VEPVRPALHEVAGSDGAAEQGARVQPQASDGVEAHLVIVVLVEALHERFVDGVQAGNEQVVHQVRSWPKLGT
jgi:hypothetical protein